MGKKLIDPNEPFKAIYSIYNHEYLGYLLSAHIVQILPNGRLSLEYQGLYPANFSQFAHGCDETDEKLVRLLYEISQQEVLKKFAGGKDASGFFLKKFNGQVKDLATEYINRRMAEALPLLQSKSVFVMGNDGYPAYREVDFIPEKATVLFHFRRTDDGTRYFPTIKLRGQKIDFQNKGAILVSMQPAWMLLNHELFAIADDVDGKKLMPFLNKWYIQVPKDKEETYYEKFISQLIQEYNVFAKGFSIESIYEKPQFQLHLDRKGDIFETRLKATYGPYSVWVRRPLERVKAVMHKNGEEISFTKVFRNQKEEEKVVKLIEKLSGSSGLFSNGYMNYQEGLQWLAKHVDALQDAGIEIIQPKAEQKISFHQPELTLETSEDGDWFDLKATVKIGEFNIPFSKFRSHILKGKRDYILPDGSVAILPEAWFSDYRHLLEIADESKEGNLRIRKYQAGILEMAGAAKTGLGSALRKIAEDGGSVGEADLPQNLNAELRFYQKKGYDWLHFLQQNSLGGILADDMGLGKTLQTLSLLAKAHENHPDSPSLVVMPTSLIWNWLNEAEKFTPDLKVLVHTGLNRDRDPEKFADYDVVLTTYGLVRQDLEILQQVPFLYVILDESQMIKNPASKTAKSVKKLICKHKLSLTGTPLENSLTDLWSQMSFLNPGLLGSENFFRDFYVTPIEKEADEKKIYKLRQLIHPFILRRTKDQVASELPPKVEQLYYCEMEPEQEELYENTLSSYRNYILDLSQAGELGKNRINVLAGLQKLRQIAIHPELVTEGMGRPSGKYDEILRMLEDVISEGSKVLVFSQFVKLLTILRKDMDARGVEYCYLDGQTRDRQEQVKRFQEDPKTQVFLMSLKAGGVGLNLTAAEYVFILDPWWNPAVERQAVDRSHRIGQQKTVFTYKFITRNTIEEKILKLQARKAKLSGDIVTVEDEVFKKLDQEALESILA